MKCLFRKFWMVAILTLPIGASANPCELLLAHQNVSEQELDLFARLVVGDSADALVYADFLQDRADSLSVARAGAIRYAIEFAREKIGFLTWLRGNRRFTKSESIAWNARALWHDVAASDASSETPMDPNEFALVFRNGVPIGTHKPRQPRAYFTFYEQGEAARNVNRFSSPEQAEVRYTAELTQWLRVPTLIYIYNQYGRIVDHPLSLWGGPTIIRATVRGVLGALYCADRADRFYEEHFYFLLHEVMRHGMEGNLAKVSALILKRLTAAANHHPDRTRALQAARAVWFDPPKKESLSRLLEVPFYPFLTPTPRVYSNIYQGNYWIPRNEDFFFFPGADGELSAPLVRRLAEALWEKLEALEVNARDFSVWREFLAQPSKIQRPSARQILREIFRIARERSDSALAPKVLFLGADLGRVEPTRVWDWVPKN